MSFINFIILKFKLNLIIKLSNILTWTSIIIVIQNNKVKDGGSYCDSQIIKIFSQALKSFKSQKLPKL